MKAIESTTEKLELGVNYYENQQETWNGIKWTSYNAKIGNSSFMCTSFEQLQETISNYKFQTEADRVLLGRAIEQFGTSA